jgi:hypothetical protein
VHFSHRLFSSPYVVTRQSNFGRGVFFAHEIHTYRLSYVYNISMMMIIMVIIYNDNSIIIDTKPHLTACYKRNLRRTILLTYNIVPRSVNSSSRTRGKRHKYVQVIVYSVMSIERYVFLLLRYHTPLSF